MKIPSEVLKSYIENLNNMKERLKAQENLLSQEIGLFIKKQYPHIEETGFVVVYDDQIKCCGFFYSSLEGYHIDFNENPDKNSIVITLE